MNYIAELIVKSKQQIFNNWREEVKHFFPIDNRFIDITPTNLLEYMDIQIHYLAIAIELENSEVYTDYIKWLLSMLKSRMQADQYLDQNMEIFNNSILSIVPEEDKELVIGYINKGMDLIKSKKEWRTDSLLSDGDVLTGESNIYLGYLVRGDKNSALKYIKSLLDENISIYDVISKILSPVGREIGRLWEKNNINVAQEHLATAISQYIVSQVIYPKLFEINISSQEIENNQKKIVSVCAGTELHEFGIRTISDLFALDGWNSLYLGGNSPISDTVEFIKSEDPDVIAISATMIFTVESVRALITALKDNNITSKILVGGYAFNHDKSLWKKVGADGYADNTSEAIKLANSWLN